ncbi:MAG: tRNA preQ1(34) S-adenosylmethionine ribosyltransferase-isomerase QueA [Bacteroidales bacterium]|jgi:S-adenosylmethionine:tRNA ribosyltransferase-isomerase|nr:tRNA preQ1(34) S-adenosylmethionine ribosyltransferase-isomerase QueA [Bacteroidales bacterium]MDD3300594.1 tRNA preQ1(34) S-adenosylmethionine ribosyltransferase-isomerase QueA [Bacteroidales bacterium]MDD3843352.1 tRNA preQ1(34) S-adenosylmethionine ribosyltransferase-isomerase QueA [Bacteroidales bacterium]MDD4617625.1 tRNA preQ1(34) S-adenosylmethionine ribosyltransferase-isomerase QueA [Bacteroidales bacterium]
MKLSQFNYNLNPDQIAKYPAKYRDESRMMVLHKKTGEIEHKLFKDILEYAGEEDLFIFNNTKVFPARLYGNKEKTGAEIEVFLLRELNRDQRLWDVLVDPARKIRIGNKLYFGENDNLVAEVIDNTTSRGRTLRFLFDGTHEEFKATLYKMGEMPIPKWIRTKAESLDTERYQTIFAEHEGAVAAPAAGLHFSRELMKRMEIKGIDSTYITLHMGLGNFRTVDVEDLSKHKMDSEQVIIPESSALTINKTKEKGKKVFAVGVTVMRAIETSVTTRNELKPFDGWTNKFIFPPYKFSIADALISNFQLPQSTMLMTAAAFGGFDNVMNAYNVAAKEGYKFGTYGDALLII